MLFDAENYRIGLAIFVNSPPSLTPTPSSASSSWWTWDRVVGVAALVGVLLLAIAITYLKCCKKQEVRLPEPFPPLLQAYY